jgi:hypothetical protein
VPGVGASDFTNMRLVAVEKNQLSSEIERERNNWFQSFDYSAVKFYDCPPEGQLLHRHSCLQLPLSSSAGAVPGGSFSFLQYLRIASSGRFRTKMVNSGFDQGVFFFMI